MPDESSAAPSSECPACVYEDGEWKCSVGEGCVVGEANNARSAATTESRPCDFKGCYRQASTSVREREKPWIGVSVCEAQATALTMVVHFYERGEPIPSQYGASRLDHAQIKRLCEQVDELETENQRLRNALEAIYAMTVDEYDAVDAATNAADIAREALDVRL